MNNMKKIEEMVNSSKNMGETVKVIAQQFNMSEDDAANIATRIIMLDAINEWISDMSVNAGISKKDVVNILGAIFEKK
jgi:hypothetical protein|nr:MAG TPA: hypothetical protein [Caudoviricetes sp.]